MNGNIHALTRGRKKRARSPAAGTAVSVRGHVRSPRGPDVRGGRRKPTVVVSNYRRGKPSGAPSSRRKKRKRR